MPHRVRVARIAYFRRSTQGVLEVLLVQKWSGVWKLPGRRVRECEHPERAVLREFERKTGFVLPVAHRMFECRLRAESPGYVEYIFLAVAPYSVDTKACGYSGNKGAVRNGGIKAVRWHPVRALPKKWNDAPLGTAFTLPVHRRQIRRCQRRFWRDLRRPAKKVSREQ
ncbi:hypothetical protein COU20_02040 [Candidatus Kaiserbacteria bacterium CG10_big_fil_rev_8_21_14_0_10_59_10]|uniref:Nudix hydrolase domain-containing protein n=1 Tax=Candidatus Kaiserbacteria bacterium CG10_big_fil_rev_8_21_14_0_10_59_10 TaxID=1974612 RepID=A0A2H0U815_9BACT|nr:MAG: hypothetical protein COU20_02040 [Candidatus Kaiserbacteria bacterium CG10_big_fil_rev_8_21_14_0_10_59_10]